MIRTRLYTIRSDACFSTVISKSIETLYFENRNSNSMQFTRLRGRPWSLPLSPPAWSSELGGWVHERLGCWGNRCAVHHHGETSKWEHPRDSSRRDAVQVKVRGLAPTGGTSTTDVGNVRCFVTGVHHADAKTASRKQVEFIDNSLVDIV